MFLDKREKQVLSMVIKIEEEILRCQAKAFSIRGFIDPEIIKELVFCGYSVSEDRYLKRTFIRW